MRLPLVLNEQFLLAVCVLAHFDPEYLNIVSFKGICDLLELYYPIKCLLNNWEEGYDADIAVNALCTSLSLLKKRFFFSHLSIVVLAFRFCFCRCLLDL